MANDFIISATASFTSGGAPADSRTTLTPQSMVEYYGVPVQLTGWGAGRAPAVARVMGRDDVSAVAPTATTLPGEGTRKDGFCDSEGSASTAGATFSAELVAERRSFLESLSDRMRQRMQYRGRRSGVAAAAAGAPTARSQHHAGLHRRGGECKSRSQEMWQTFSLTSPSSSTAPAAASPALPLVVTPRCVVAPACRVRS